MVKLRNWILQKTGAASLAAVPDLIVLGDFNLTNSADLLAIMPMPLVRANWRDYIMANPTEKAGTTLWTNPLLSDHNALASSLDQPILHDRYEKWALAAFSDAELRAGLGAKSANPDGDAHNNFAEYAMNLHPLRSQGEAAAVAGGAFHFRRGAGRKDARFALESSLGLGAWDLIASALHGGAMVPTGNNPPFEESQIEQGETIITTVEKIVGEPRMFFRQRTTEDINLPQP